MQLNDDNSLQMGITIKFRVPQKGETFEQYRDYIVSLFQDGLEGNVETMLFQITDYALRKFHPERIVQV